MKYFLDTEFIEQPGTIQLISIGIVADNGDTFYAISSEFDETLANDWVKENVIAKLEKDYPRSPISVIKANLLNFIARCEGVYFHEEAEYDLTGKEVEFFGYYADYDWVVFCWIFGRMIDLPKGFPMLCYDLKQMMVQAGLDKAWKQRVCPDPILEHNALADAYWNRKLYKKIEEIRRFGK